jgi:hypothetical protein
MRRFIERYGSTPLLFAIITILAYGLLLPFTGFYWDDWPFAWIAHFLGPEEFIPAFESFRPFLGPIFFLTTSLIPTEPIYWQIFMLVIRFCGTFSLVHIQKVWHHPGSIAASFLFLSSRLYTGWRLPISTRNSFAYFTFSPLALLRAIRTLGEPDPGDWSATDLNRLRSSY